MAPKGSDSELGEQELLMRADDYTSPFYFYGTSGLGWTDNVNLNKHHDADMYFWSTLDLIYRPRIHQNLYADIGLSYDVYRHEDHHAADVDEQDVHIGLMRMLPRIGDSAIFLHYTYDRLLDGSDYDEIYTGHGVQAGIDKLVPLGSRSSVYARAFSKFGVDSPSPDFARRHEYQFLAAYQVQPIDALEAQIFYRARLYDFRTGGREDLNHLLGISVSYWFNDALGLTTSFSWASNHSSAEGGDYEVFDGGLSLALQYNF